MSEPLLVVDAGSSSIRAVVVDAAGRPGPTEVRPLVTRAPADGLAEFDPDDLAGLALDAARTALGEAGPVAGVGVANQRASTIVWDRSTGRAVGPGLGWQDLRTVGRCLELQGLGIQLAPNATATKAEALLDGADPDRTADLCIGTVDSWLAWHLTDGAEHVTDATNAGVTGLWRAGDGWHEPTIDALRIPVAALPRVVDTSGAIGTCSALPGQPPLLSLVGDQQASLLGQGCVEPGQAKITFGTGAMLDVVAGPASPEPANGTFPIVAWRHGGVLTWATEAIVLTAGAALDWAWRDLGLAPSAAATDALAASVESSEGVVFVPALLGLGTPHFDYGARGALFGVTRGTTAAHVVRAVLEGIAHRGADLVEAAELDAGRPIGRLRIDGGMAANETFVQALADATGRLVEVAPVTEATALGAAFHAGLAAGTWADLEEISRLWRPSRVVEPVDEPDRARWRLAVERAARHHPDLSALSF